MFQTGARFFRPPGWVRCMRKAHVVFDRQSFEDFPPLGHEHDPTAGDLVGGQPEKRLLPEADRAFEDLGVVDRQKSRYGTDRGALTGAVGAEHRNDALLWNFEGHALHRDDDATVVTSRFSTSSARPDYAGSKSPQIPRNDT